MSTDKSVLFLAAIGIGIGIGAGIWKSDQLIDDGGRPVPPTTTDNPVTTTLMTTTDVSTAAVSTSKVTTTAEVTTTPNVITTAAVTTTAMDFSFDYNNPMLGQMRGLRGVVKLSIYNQHKLYSLKSSYKCLRDVNMTNNDH